MSPFLPLTRLFPPLPLQSGEWHAWLLEADRKSYRPALMELLTAYTGQPPQFAVTHRHKPYLTNSPLQFNVSHSGAYTLVAFTLLDTIGVDIEEIKNFEDMEGIAATHFTASERRHLDFFTTWTRKESYVKALGEGLYIPLESIDVTGDPPGYSIYTLEAPPGYAAAITVPGVTHRYRLWLHAPQSDAPQ